MIVDDSTPGVEGVSSWPYAGPSAIPTGERVLAVDIHTSDGLVHRLTEIEFCEMTLKSRFLTLGNMMGQMGARAPVTEMQVTAKQVQIFAEPQPTKKVRRK